MFFGEPFRQERVTNGARERDVHDPSSVHVPDFRISKPEFPASEAVRMDRDLRPRGNLGFESFRGVHILFDERT